MLSVKLRYFLQLYWWKVLQINFCSKQVCWEIDEVWRQSNLTNQFLCAHISFTVSKLTRTWNSFWVNEIYSRNRVSTVQTTLWMACRSWVDLSCSSYGWEGGPWEQDYVFFLLSYTFSRNAYFLCLV